MLLNLAIFIVSLIVVIKSATYATRFASALAETFHISNYVVGFLVVAVISILPETFISINSALEGVPAFGLGTLFGSNIADLTLVFVLIVLISGRAIKIESKILKNNNFYPLLLLLPLVLGFDGYFSRIEGISLIITGLAFYFLAFQDGHENVKSTKTKKENRWKNIGLLLLSMAFLLLGSNYTVTSASELAHYLGVSPILIGMLVVGIGTTMPELLFSLKAVRNQKDSLAVGDVLGTVLADATIVVGILAIINPFAFPKKIIYVTGVFMVLASILLFYFMRTGKVVSKKESVALLLFFLTFVIVEFLVNS